ncbi:MULTISPECIES: hypothetical protein [unclassified Cobetia]|uniref:hypothetical protein n=1 Tax=unclassified Cobetia TaxID=2609414 RepID=UPI00178C9473|nr:MULTISPECIES: hypothetical protein [unclassified Cobetia]MBE2167741.1 hypothetical protein [Cobetia sp. 2AS1]MDH2446164.1 hypothetical protein [Cobetia sp. 2AS]
MNYNSRFMAAVKYTESLGLNVKEMPAAFTEKLSHSTLQEIFQLCGDALYHYGFNDSTDLASQCVRVHSLIKQHLKDDMGIDSYITIGDRYWDDYIYCEMSRTAIEQELTSPEVDQPIKAHVWLTLSDGAIIDCTAEAHADIIFGRDVHPSHQCIMLITPDQEEDAKVGYHRPYLVGEDFINKTGMVRVFAM